MSSCLREFYTISCIRKEQSEGLHKEIHLRKLIKANCVCLYNLPEFYVCIQHFPNSAVILGGMAVKFLIYYLAKQVACLLLSILVYKSRRP